jgi:hypothetical protein
VIVAVKPTATAFRLLALKSVPVVSFNDVRNLWNPNNSFSGRFEIVSGALSFVCFGFHEFSMSNNLLNLRQYPSVVSFPTN